MAVATRPLRTEAATSSPTRPRLPVPRCAAAAPARMLARTSGRTEDASAAPRGAGTTSCTSTAPARGRSSLAARSSTCATAWLAPEAVNTFAPPAVTTNAAVDVPVLDGPAGGGLVGIRRSRRSSAWRRLHGTIPGSYHLIDLAVDRDASPVDEPDAAPSALSHGVAQGMRAAPPASPARSRPTVRLSAVAETASPP